MLYFRFDWNICKVSKCQTVGTQYYPIYHSVLEESVTILIDQARETFGSNGVIAAKDVTFVKV